VIHFQEKGVPCYQASPKIFEGLACQGFILCDDQPDVVRFFHDHEHLVIFKDNADMLRKISYYLEHADERRRIAQTGYQAIKGQHTYLNRLQSLFDLVKDNVYENV